MTRQGDNKRFSCRQRSFICITTMSNHTMPSINIRNAVIVLASQSSVIKDIFFMLILRYGEWYIFSSFIVSVPFFIIMAGAL